MHEELQGGPGGQATGGGGVAAGPFEADKHRTFGLGLWVRGCGRRRELSKGEGRTGTRGSGREPQSGDGDAGVGGAANNGAGVRVKGKPRKL